MTINTPYGEMMPVGTTNALPDAAVQEIIDRYFYALQTESDIALATGRTKNAVSKVISRVFAMRSKTYPH